MTDWLRQRVISMSEVWRDIPGYEGLYRVSNLGRVYSTRAKRELKTHDNGHGYQFVGLHRRGQHKLPYVHRLVAEVFVPNPLNKSEVNHIDGDKNNNAADNLEWTTPSENQLHSRRVLGNWTGPPKKAVVCVETQEEFSSTHEAARTLGINQASISAACLRQQRTAGNLHFKFKEDI